ncbi:MAG TPA: MauE/DoxX family redox-associated membrane protein [Polyangiales bacterium]|nr:MauE/DoxX family redox-associated membrane protein [Polyangiales bacterium]
MRERRVWLWVLRGLLAALFAYAAVPKLIDPGEFAAAIQNYRAVPDTLVGYLALFVPVFELVIALGLLLPGYQRGAALLATVMLLAFGAAMAQARWRGIDLSCGCFGAAFEAKVSWLTVARTLGLGALSGVLLFAAQKEPRASEPLSP